MKVRFRQLLMLAYVYVYMCEKESEAETETLTFLWWSDCDGLGCELLIEVSGVCLRRHLRLEGRDELGRRREEETKRRD